MSVKGYVDHVEVVGDGGVIATHPRCYGERRKILNLLHFLGVLIHKPATLDHAPVFRDWQLPPALTLCVSESFEALAHGLQNALWELGDVPKRHRSDNLAAAVNNLSATREFQTRYRDLLTYYGLAGQRITLDCDVNRATF